MADFRVSEVGSGPRLVLVHGSVANAEMTWGAQLPLAESYTLVLPDRPGFPPNPPVDRVDFEEHAALIAELLEPGDHLVGHSYGGVVSLLTAALAPERVRSLTVIEPPCLKVAAGDPLVDAFVARSARLWEEGPTDPEEFLRAFLAAVGSSLPSGSLSPSLLQGAQTLMVERYPWEADIPLEAVRAAPFPKLVVSGAHDPAFDAVCDVLEAELDAERLVLAGAGHSPQRLGEPFNSALAEFLEWAS